LPGAGCGAAQIPGVDLTVRLLPEQLLAVAAGFLLFLSRDLEAAPRPLSERGSLSLQKGRVSTRQT
jgi:hypothetical protein